MKKILSAGCGFLMACGLRGADDAPLKFGGERIGVPPLSLRESMGKGAITPGSPQFGTHSRAYSEPNGRPDGSLNLLPSSGPNLESLKAARDARAPRISREFGMPIIEPSDTVDYKLTIIAPNPAVDFKMVLKDPSPKLPERPAK